MIDYAVSNGAKWGDIVYDEIKVKEETETLDQRLKRINAEAVAAKLAELESKRYECKQYEEKMEYKSKCMGKKMLPCKNLYNDESVPKSQYIKKKDKDGRIKLCAPECDHVASECWGYEYVDPLSQTFVNPQTGAWLPEALKKGLPDKGRAGKLIVTKRDGKYVVLNKPHTCVYLHPGEEGWQPQWQKDKNWKSAEQLADPRTRFSALKGKGGF